MPEALSQLEHDVQKFYDQSTAQYSPRAPQNWASQHASLAARVAEIAKTHPAEADELSKKLGFARVAFEATGQM